MFYYVGSKSCTTFIARDTEYWTLNAIEWETFVQNLDFSLLCPSPPLQSGNWRLLNSQLGNDAFYGMIVCDDTSKTQLIFSKLQIPYNPQTALTSSTSLSHVISGIFDANLRFTSQNDKWLEKGKALFDKQVDFFISSSLPIHFILPAFPCKSSNSDKVLGTLPDQGEYLAIKTMSLVGELIQKVYPPGAKFLIVSDGHVFSDVF